MSENMDELKQEATELGITFSPNIGEAKLREKIEAKYAEIEEANKAEELSISEDVMEEAEGHKVVTSFAKKAAMKAKTVGEMARIAKEKATKTRVVEIIDNDPKFNAYSTTVTATCGNEYFDLGSIIYPLNTPVEMAQGHINALREVEFPHHQVGPDGTSYYTMRKRFTVSYRDDLKE
jgi:hypothetical protein